MPVTIGVRTLADRDLDDEMQALRYDIEEEEHKLRDRRRRLAQLRQEKARRLAPVEIGDIIGNIDGRGEPVKIVGFDLSPADGSLRAMVKWADPALSQVPFELPGDFKGMKVLC